MLDVGLPAAFGAGILSFLSPCILPLVPSYLCFLAGASLETLTRNPGGTPNARLIGRAVAFVLGFAVVFVALGASASGVGRLVSENLTVLNSYRGAGDRATGPAHDRIAAVRILIARDAP